MQKYYISIQTQLLSASDQLVQQNKFIMDGTRSLSLCFEDYDGTGEDSSESYYCYFHGIRHIIRIIKGSR